jgi:hypothetical protein
MTPLFNLPIYPVNQPDMYSLAIKRPKIQLSRVDKLKLWLKQGLNIYNP